MLYPKEDEVERKLLFTCRTCSYSEEATSSCIFRNVLNNAAGETAGVTQDVGSDPTVSESSSVDGSLASEKEALSLVFCVCCGVPIQCGVCEKNAAVMEGPEEPYDNQGDPARCHVEWDLTDEHFGAFVGQKDKFLANESNVLLWRLAGTGAMDEALKELALSEDFALDHFAEEA